MLRLFLSYAREDAERVRCFSSELRRSGIEPWMDDELKLAGRWNQEIEQRIAACHFFIPLLSRATGDGDKTRFFRKEWSLAAKAQRAFLPVLLEECRLPEPLPRPVATALNRQRQELFPSYEDGLRRILRFLHDEKRTGAFEETFSCLGTDNAGWRLGGWQLDEADSTGENSRSLRAAANLDIGRGLPQTVRHVAAIDVDLPGRPLLLRYRRRLRLTVPFDGAAEFRVLVDGEVVDTASHDDPAEADWTTRSVPVPDRGSRRVALEFTVAVTGGMNFFPLAEAWVDDIRIA